MGGLAAGGWPVAGSGPPAGGRPRRRRARWAKCWVRCGSPTPRCRPDGCGWPSGVVVLNVADVVLDQGGAPPRRGRGEPADGGVDERLRRTARAEDARRGHRRSAAPAVPAGRQLGERAVTAVVALYSVIVVWNMVMLACSAPLSSGRNAERGGANSSRSEATGTSQSRCSDMLPRSGRTSPGVGRPSAAHNAGPSQSCHSHAPSWGWCSRSHAASFAAVGPPVRRRHPRTPRSVGSITIEPGTAAARLGAGSRLNHPA